MANMNEKEFFFPYWGPYVMQTKVEQELIDILLEKGKKSREKNLDSRKHLAGVIKNEYYYEEVEKWFIPKFLPYVDMYVRQVKGYSNCLFKALNSEWTYYLTSLWINYQQAKEYNPPHHHTGDLSFVTYLQIPDEIKKENEKMQGVQNNAGPGCINFNYGIELPFSVSSFAF